jgi:diguanylate cyclase (GGDEF)-like protein
MRRFSLPVLLVAICLLPVGIGTGMSAHGHAVAALEGALANKASEEAQVLEDYFSRAQSIDLLTANNPAFQDFYEQPGGRAAKVRSGGRVLDRANQALGYLEQLFPDSIGEACFIDRGGPENARMVRGVRATPAELSPDESGNPFFAPTFALRHGQVYQARPYVSPDTKEWVISNSTLMPTADGSKRAIVHFEVTIESFRQVPAQLSSRFDIAVVDARTGAVVLDSRRPQRVGATLGSPADHRFGPLVAGGNLSGLRSVGDRPVAYQRLRHQRGNANDWYVLAAARGPVGALYGVSGWSVAIVLVALVLLVVAAVSFLAHHRMLVATSLADALTGIGNRRRLRLDLERGLKEATVARPLLLMLFDLNGFKAYNDTFGHPAGDALLVRLATALDAAMAQHAGTAYRLGGDEFCILTSVDADATTPVVAAAAEALSEHGPGFSVAASYGAILLPRDSRDPSEAMRLVDQRMYAQKTSNRRSPDRQTRDALLRALQERNPELAERHAAVARLSEAVGHRMGLPAEAQAELRRAAELHDVGKLAVPGEVLRKPGPLDPEEWAFVQRHPLIGERIIAAAPALAAAARLVRSTHERLDGCGYPDGLAGEQIPLGARIIAACDAFAAMTSPRPYAAQRTIPEAVAELRHCAGSQFDPAVVDALAELVAELELQHDRAATAHNLGAVHEPA